jgi:hypothetical protein
VSRRFADLTHPRLVALVQKWEHVASVAAPELTHRWPFTGRAP